MCDRLLQGAAMDRGLLFAMQENTRAAVYWSGGHWNVMSVMSPTWVLRKGFATVGLATRQAHARYIAHGQDELTQLLESAVKP